MVTDSDHENRSTSNNQHFFYIYFCRDVILLLIEFHLRNTIGKDKVDVNSEKSILFKIIYEYPKSGEISSR